jgi:hypothetical protein
MLTDAIVGFTCGSYKGTKILGKLQVGVENNLQKSGIPILE